MIQTNAARAIIIHDKEVEVVGDKVREAADLGRQEWELGDVEGLLPGDEAALRVVLINLLNNGNAVLDDLKHARGVIAEIETLPQVFVIKEPVVVFEAVNWRELVHEPVEEVVEKNASVSIRLQVLLPRHRIHLVEAAELILELPEHNDLEVIELLPTHLSRQGSLLARTVLVLQLLALEHFSWKLILIVLAETILLLGSEV